MRRILFTLLGISIYGLLIIEGSLLYVEPLNPHWPHEQDTPMVKLDDTEQWICVTEGTPGAWGWCTDASLDEDSLDNH